MLWVEIKPMARPTFLSGGLGQHVGAWTFNPVKLALARWPSALAMLGPGQNLMPWARLLGCGPFGQL
jgi:hypothetical protein